MTILLLIWSNKRWVLIIVLSILYLVQIAYTKHLVRELEASEVKCDQRVDEVKGKLIDMYVQQAKQLNQVSVNLAAKEIEINKHFEKVRDEKERIKTNVVYRNVCSNADGRSLLNNEIKTVNASIASQLNSAIAKAQ